MSASAIPAAIAAKDAAEIRAAMVKELVPVIPDATDPVTWDPRELESSGGNVWAAVAWQGRLWFRDDASTAAADETTCIVLLDGGHYLTNDVRFPGVVESRTVATPPDSAGTDPSVVGKAWRIAAAATDSWSGHEDDVVLGSGRGWQFHTPQVGEEHYVRDEKLYESFTEDDVWATRTAAFASDSVPLSALLWDGRVENQTTNSPPSTWSKGVAYIVGSSATGDWSGDTGKLAIAESDGVLANGDTFTIYAPWTGLTVYDKALGINVRWSGTAWVSAAGAIISTVYVDTKTYSTFNSSYVIPYDDTIPQITEGGLLLTAPALTPQSTDSKIDISVSIPLFCATTDIITAAVFVNSASNAIWAEPATIDGARRMISFSFRYSPGSTSAQTFTLRVGSVSGATFYVNGNASSRQLGGVCGASMKLQETV